MAATQALVAAGGAFLTWRFIDSKLQLSNDVVVAKRLLPLKKEVTKHVTEGYSVAQYWIDAVKAHPKKECIVFEDRSYTFTEFDQMINKTANFFTSMGLKKGDVVSIFMENCPEFIMCYLALAKLGILSALINCNLVQKGLVHCISVSNSKAIIYNPALAGPVAEIESDLRALGLSHFWSIGEGVPAFGQAIDAMVASQSAQAPSLDHIKGIQFTDKFAYIYTSGTTGLPKAAIITHQKMFSFGALISRMFLLTSNDRNLCVLPLYHSSACIGVSSMMYVGCTLILRKKFSASNFWKEAADYRATACQYIGELCRYLLNTPPSPHDRAHKVRIAIGNGLRPDIWNKFQTRFNIPEIGEFYGATEGNAAYTNHCTTKQDQGAVGREGWLVRSITKKKIVRFNVETEQVVRGSDGFCIECGPGEAGELIGPIIDTEPTSRFEGYTDPAATKKKIITDAFAKGDKFFRTGDLMMRDSRGYYYFVDRIGDTFRWKGENVSTTEVAEIVSLFPGVKEANVYGVQVPGKDGRACMVGLVADSNLDLDGLLQLCKDQLPAYAVPMFLRLLKQVEITGTFKHQKVQLRKEGIDLGLVQDPIYWLNPATKKYELFSQDALQQISSGQAKL